MVVELEFLSCLIGRLFCLPPDSVENTTGTVVLKPTVYLFLRKTHEQIPDFRML